MPLFKLALWITNQTYLESDYPIIIE